MAFMQIAMDGAPMSFLQILLLLFACFAADLCLSLLQGRLRGLRLLLLVPLPAAIVAAVFGLTYFVGISVDRLERAWWTATLFAAVWSVGFVYCAVAMAIQKFMRARMPPPNPPQERFP
jgi:hypothetical protein